MPMLAEPARPAPSSIAAKLGALGFAAEPEAWAWCRVLARITALKHRPDGGFDLGHWWRGPLLYALTRRTRPPHILEFGTGRGYGAACMAQAILDEGYDGTVWTLDQIPGDAPQVWALDDGTGPRLTTLSRDAAWAAHLASALRGRIRCVTGDSRRLMPRWLRDGRPRVACAFIDAGHDGASVRHDCLAVLRVAAEGCSLIFDDYTDRPGYGVKRLVDEVLAPRLPRGAVEILDTDASDVTDGGGRAAHGMAIVDGAHLTAERRQALIAALAAGGVERRDALRAAGQRLRHALGAGLRAIRGPRA
jgi:hypothetical protein